MFKDRPEEDRADEEDEDRRNTAAIYIPFHDAEPDHADEREREDDGINPGDIV